MREEIIERVKTCDAETLDRIKRILDGKGCLKSISVNQDFIRIDMSFGTIDARVLDLQIHGHENDVCKTVFKIDTKKGIYKKATVSDIYELINTDEFSILTGLLVQE